MMYAFPVASENASLILQQKAKANTINRTMAAATFCVI
jgi:hypothetical protein